MDRLGDEGVSQLAQRVVRSWQQITQAAWPALTVLRGQGFDEPIDVEAALDLLASSDAWRGPMARAVKRELRRRVELHLH